MEGWFAPKLFLNVDDDNHGALVPETRMPLGAYEAAIHATVDDWELRDWRSGLSEARE